MMILTLGKFLMAAALAAPAPGQQLAPVTLAGETGGKIDGTPWSSSMIKDKVWVFFYIDPDRRDANEELKDALKAQNFPKDKYGTIAVINMDASWLPNSVIASSLKSNQEKFPDVVYVKDMKKALVGQWKMTDDEYDVLAFDKAGKVIYAKDGDFGKKDIAALIDTIKKNLD